MFSRADSTSTYLFWIKTTSHFLISLPHIDFDHILVYLQVALFLPDMAISIIEYSYFV